MGKGLPVRLTLIDVVAVIAMLLKIMGVNAYGAGIAERAMLRDISIWQAQALGPEVQRILYLQGKDSESRDLFRVRRGAGERCGPAAGAAAV